MTKTDCGYEICVRNHVDDIWQDLFNGISLSKKTNGETVITIPEGDQALLHGILARIRDLNLTLLSVRKIDPTSCPNVNTKRKE